MLCNLVELLDFEPTFLILVQIERERIEDSVLLISTPTHKSKKTV